MKDKSLYLVALLPLLVHAYPYNPGPGACENLIPLGHSDSSGNRPASKDLPSIYNITTDSDQYTPNQEIKVTLQSLVCQRDMKGFLIQARPADPATNSTSGIGTFINFPEGTQQWCETNGVFTAATQTSREPKNSVELTWKAPATAAGHIVFVVTFIEGKTEFWVAQRSAVVRDPNVPLPSYQLQADPVVAPDPCVAGDLLPKPSECGGSRGCYSDCTQEGCNFVISWRDEKDHVMFTVTAKHQGITQGYIAVGFSDDQKMGADGVTACVYTNSAVIVRNSQNDGRQNRGIDTLVANGTGSYRDGTLECSFEISDNVADTNPLFDVEADKYLLFVKGTSLDGENLRQHTSTPIASQSMADFQSTSALTGEEATDMFVKIHGCLMVVAWIFSASIGIVIARYFKPQWPDSTACGEKVWFQLHRCFMLLVFAAAVIAFVIIFVDVQGYSDLGEEASKKAHPILGIIVTALMVINPIMAMFRPHPGDSNRPIFNWAHFGVGQAAHILAVVTIFLGVNLGRPAIPRYVTWILVGYVAWQVLIELLLVIVGCSTESKDRRENYELAQNGQTVKRQQTVKKQNSSPVRQVLLMVHTIAIVGVSTAVILIIILS